MDKEVILATLVTEVFRVTLVFLAIKDTKEKQCMACLGKMVSMENQELTENLESEVSLDLLVKKDIQDKGGT